MVGADGRARAAGPAASGPGTSTASTSRPAAASRPGRLLRVPAERAARAGRRSGSRSAAHLIGGLYRHGAVASSRRPASARRWSRSAPWPPGSPTRSTTRRRRRPAPSTPCDRDLRHACSSSLRRLADERHHRRAVRRARRAAPRARARPAPLDAARDSPTARRSWPTGSARHGVDRDWALAAPLVAAAGVDVAWCERAAAACSARRRSSPALEWVASTLSTTTAARPRCKESTRRVSELVAAVRSYSQLDRASRAAHRRHRGPREHAGRCSATSCAAASTVVRDYDADVPRDRGVRRRAQPGLDQPHRQRRRRDGRRRHAAARRPRRDGDARRRRDRRHRARACPPRSRPARSSRSSPPRTSARAPASASTSPAGSSSSGTAARSTIESRPGDTVLRVRLPVDGPHAPSP